MLELIAANWPVFLVAMLIGVATAWWVWARHHVAADVDAPKIAPSAPKAVADLAKEMPTATEPVALMDAAVAAPKAKVATTAKTKTKAVAKPKADPIPTAKPASAPKAKAAPVKKSAAPKAKTETVKSKVATPAQPKAAAPKAAKPAKVAATAPAKAEAKPKAAPKAKAVTSEKPKTAAKPKAAPKPIIPDNLELLKGVGPKLNTLLKSLGVTSFEQVANWSAADVREIDSRLGNFAGRIGRDNWIDQAKLLVAGDVKGFEKKYGSLGSEIQKG
jgi:predicted flap endonuclease-1-like 5' DNA nuclease